MSQAREDELGVPFPGAPVAPEKRTHGRVSLPRRGPFDWRATFAREAPRVVDLGCGNGRYVIGSALARPTHDHLGIDLVPPAVQHAARRAGERGLANARFCWGDALDLLFLRLEPSGVDEVHVYHPQPYYDATKTDRRLLTPEVFARIHEVLRPGGLLVLQTDNPTYWKYITKVVPHFFDWSERDGPWPDAPLGRSRREIQARAKGLRVFRGSGTRRAMTADRAAALARGLPRPTFDANKAGFRGRPARGRKS